MLQGLRTLVYQVADLDAAKGWYAELLGIPPYFDEPFYVGFNVGGYELGLQPRPGADAAQAKDAVTYWGVANAQEVYARLLALGGRTYQPVQDVGGDIRLGAVTDLSGNILGVIENPHFLAAKSLQGSEGAKPGLTFSLHIHQDLLEQTQEGAQSAKVSLEEYIGKCAVDGLYRGYR